MRVSRVHARRLPDQLLTSPARGCRCTRIKDERPHHGHPVVSVSLGLPATFQFGGLKRSDRPPTRMALSTRRRRGVGGAARLSVTACWQLKDGEHPRDRAAAALNLTLR